MESNFTAGIIIGIIIGIVGVNLFATSQNSSVTVPQVKTRTIVVPNSGYNYDYNDYSERDDYDYESRALHVRPY